MAKLPDRFSLTMPSLAAKKARTWEIKCRSLEVRPSQSLRSAARSISSAVQKEASAFLYICQICGGVSCSVSYVHVIWQMHELQMNKFMQHI